MRHLLQRHPVPIRAFFGHCLVLTYAFPREVLEPLLRPGLVLDTFGELGFAAVAMVQTRRLRPAFLPPSCGLDFFLAGYRIFARFKTAAGRSLRGLQILRSDTDRALMAFSGNLLTHYNYQKVSVRWEERDGSLEIEVRTPKAEADLHLVADLTGRPGPLPEGSPFASVQEARRFAGPLPFTFDYEPETNSMIRIEGVRQEWHPEPVAVEVRAATFFHQPRFAGAEPVLANAFHLQDVPYLWRRGVRERLPEEAP
jgi:hypothetical protein